MMQDNYRKKILITGGAGFIGCHLAAELIKRGNEVIVVDNFYTGREGNLQPLLGGKNFKLIRHDVKKPFYFKVDQIYNLACPASPIHYQRTPIRTIETCVLGAMNSLKLARKVKAKILQASTSEVYGDPILHPQPESYWGNVNPIGVRGCYDEGKRVAETLFFDFHREAGVEIRVARIFNTYGPRMSINDGRVVSNFVMQALKNKPITIFGDGSQTRSFCYVSETVDALIRLMNKEDVTGPVNVGSTQEMRIKKVAEMIVELSESNSRLVFKPLPINDPLRR